MKLRSVAAVWMITGAVALCAAPRPAHAQASPDSAAFTHHDSTATATPAPAPAPATPPPAAAPVTATASGGAATMAVDAGMFSKGKRRVTGMAGWGQSLGQDYLLVGIGVGYFIRNGLDVGVDFEGWFIGDPQMYKLTPRFDYVLYKAKRIKPYAGGFYRYTFMGSGIDDQSSMGGRAGAFYQSRGGRSMAGAGVVYERYLNLDERLGSSYVVYPEFFIATSF